MNVISVATVKRHAAIHPDASSELMKWSKTARLATWTNLSDVRFQFPDADQYRSLLIFNIRRNYYRLIVKVDYRAKLLLVKDFLTHDVYMREAWKKWAH